METPIYNIRVDDDGGLACDHEDITLGDHLAREDELGVVIHHNRDGALREMARNVGVLLQYHERAFLEGPLFLAPMRGSDFAHLGGNAESVVSRNFSGSLMRFRDEYVEPSWLLSGFHAKIGDETRYVAGLPAFSGIQAALLAQLATRFVARASDQQVTDLLAAHGLQIARRTVAKYRATVTDSPPPGFFGPLHEAAVSTIQSEGAFRALFDEVREHNRERSALFDGPPMPMVGWRRIRTKRVTQEAREPQSVALSPVPPNDHRDP